MNLQNNSCPDDEQLEGVAVGASVEHHLLHHINQCDTCKDKLDEIRSNNQFLNLLAHADPFESHAPPQSTLHEEETLPNLLPSGYKIECELHRGGHGIVYRATQIRTNRPVAIKMLILGTLATPRQRLRFEREAEIVAALQHPGIVTIYDAGYLSDGRFGFAMEFVDGETLDRWSGKARMNTQADIRTLLELFVLICDAVSFAHQFGIVHRDLKPANILIDRENKPHILDFGIAKVLKEDTDTPSTFGHSSQSQSPHTMPGEFSGTLAYASPEQVSGDPKRIDLRTDIYSLGVILYELLSKNLPYSPSGPISEVIRRIQSDTPAPITRHTPIIPRDLSEIVAHALQKDKLDRYESVHDLSEDIKYFLEGRPIQIRRDSALYVLRKTVRRKWIAASLLSLSLLALTLFSIAMTALYVQKNRAETDAILQLRSRGIAHAHTEGLIGDSSLALDMLWNAQLVETKGLDAPQEMSFGNAFEPIDSYWELWSFYARNPCLRTTSIRNQSASAVALSSDNNVAAFYLDSQLLFYSTADHRLMRTLDIDLPDWLIIDENEVGIGFHDDNKAITLLGINGIALFDAFTGQFISSHQLPNRPFYSIRIVLPDGTVASSDIDRRFTIIDPLHEYRELHLDTELGNQIAGTLSPQGTLLATTTHHVSNHVITDSTISIWNMPAGDLVTQCVIPGTIRAALFSPDLSSILFTKLRSEKLVLWNLSEHDSQPQVISTPRYSMPLTWLNGTEQVVCVESAQSFSIFDIKTKNQTHVFTGSSGHARHAIPNESNSTLTTVSYDSLKVWDLDPQLWNTLPNANEYAHHDFSISPDGKQLAWARNKPGDYRINISSITSDSKPIVIDDQRDLITSIAFNHQGTQLVWSLANGQITLWDTVHNIQTDTFKDHQSGVRSIAMSPTQNILASGGEDGRVILRNLDTGKTQTLLAHSKRVPKVIFRADGRVLASCSMDGTVRLWDVPTGSLLKVIDLEQGVYAMSFSPDNVHLAAGGRGQNITIINTLTDQQTSIQGDSSYIFSLDYGPQGRVLVSGDLAGNVSIWDTQSTQRLAQLPKHEQMVMSIQVSTDGKSMISCSASQRPELRLWDLTTFNQHIAGNLEYHASRLEKEINKEPVNLGAMRRWAAKIHGTQQ